MGLIFKSLQQGRFQSLCNIKLWAWQAWLGLEAWVHAWLWVSVSCSIKQEGCAVSEESSACKLIHQQQEWSVLCQHSKDALLNLLNCWELNCWSEAALWNKVSFFPPSVLPKRFSCYVLCYLTCLGISSSSACVYTITLMDMLWTQTFSQGSYCACSFDKIDFQISLSNCLASYSVSPRVPYWNNWCREQKLRFVYMNHCNDF